MAGGPPTAAELPAKMRAVQYDAFGGGAAGLKLVEVPVPSPKKNEVLLKLEAATLNPVDWKIQKGMQRPLLPRRLPHIPVTDVAGVVVAVGPGVREFKPGDEVVAMLNILHGGGLAEYAVASEKTTVKRPPGVSAADAAGLPTAARTALVALRAVGARFNDDDGGGRKNTTSSKKQPVNVLVTGASGGVGHYAVQLARAAGLHVTATCGAHAAEAVRGLLNGGEVLDYATPEGAALRSPSGRRYDGVVHCAPVGTRWSTFRPVLADSGATVVDLTPTKSAMLRSVAHAVTFARKRLVPLFLWPNCEDLQLLVGMMADGKLKTVVDSRFPLSQASQAWERSLGGHPTGKIVVEMGHASI